MGMWNGKGKKKEKKIVNSHMSRADNKTRTPLRSKIYFVHVGVNFFFSSFSFSSFLLISMLSLQTQISFFFGHSINVDIANVMGKEN